VPAIAAGTAVQKDEMRQTLKNKGRVETGNRFRESSGQRAKKGRGICEIACR